MRSAGDLVLLLTKTMQCHGSEEFWNLQYDTRSLWCPGALPRPLCAGLPSCPAFDSSLAVP